MQNNTKDSNNERNLSEVYKELQESRNTTSNTGNINKKKSTKKIN